MANATPVQLPPQMPTLRQPRPPSLATVSTFLQSLFPRQRISHEVPWSYHISRGFPHRPRMPVNRLVLSITPTPEVYTALHEAEAIPGSEYVALFLHRPWTLERSEVPRTVSVWACHKAFDEALTVGANLVLAERLGMGVDLGIGKGRLMVGYKGDPERRIGVVAGIEGGEIGVSKMRERVRKEFGGEVEAEFGFDGESGEGVAGMLKGVAIMNAFHGEEVERVAEFAMDAGLVESTTNCSSLLYLTGAVREPGLIAAREKGMKVICVGHKVCELWGMEYMAEMARKEFPALDIVLVNEEEIKPEPEQKPSPAEHNIVGEAEAK